MKKSFKLAIAAFASLLTLGGVSSTGFVAHAEETRVEVIAKGFQHDFWKAVNKGAEKAAGELGAKINFVGPQNETAIAEQLEQLNNAINKNPKAIALAALDTEAELDAINMALSKNIPIIGFDSGVPGAPEGAIKATASTDNHAAGGNAAEHLFPMLEGKVKDKPVRIGVISQEANSLSITQRTSGFIDKMVELFEKKGVKVAVVGHDKFKNNVAEADAKVIIEVRVPAQVDDAAGKTEASTVLEKEDTIAIYGSNEFAAKAIINAHGSIANVVVEGAEFRQTGMVGKVISDVDFVFMHNGDKIAWSIKIYSGGHHSYNMVGEIWADGADPAEAVQVY